MKTPGSETNILDRITDGIVALDKDWRYAYLNQQAAEGWQTAWMSGTWGELLVKLENNEIDISPNTGWTKSRREWETVPC